MNELSILMLALASIILSFVIGDAQSRIKVLENQIQIQIQVQNGNTPGK